MLVRVLGKPSIPERADLVRRELVLAVYLACKGRPVSTSSVQDAVWNGRAVQPKTVWNLVGRTRSKLGVFEDGTAVMPQVDRLQNTLQLADGVVTDHAVLRSLYEQALVVSSTEAVGLLRSGLSLVEGPPFDAAGYDWAHHTEQYVADASALIERSAEQLVELAGNAGDADLAREAIMFGLRGLPGNEVLYRARMRLEHQAGNLTAVRSAYSALVSFLDELEAEPSSATLELYRQLTGTAQTLTVVVSGSPLYGGRPSGGQELPVPGVECGCDVNELFDDAMGVQPCDGHGDVIRRRSGSGPLGRRGESVDGVV